MSLSSETKKYYRETHPQLSIPLPPVLAFLKRVWPSLLALLLCAGLCISSTLFMYDSDAGNWLFLTGIFGGVASSLIFLQLSGIRSALLRFMLQHLVIDLFLLILLASEFSFLLDHRFSIYISPVFAGLIFTLQLADIIRTLSFKRKKEEIIVRAWQLAVPLLYGSLLLAGILYSLFIIWFIHSMSHLDLGPVFFKWDC